MAWADVVGAVSALSEPERRVLGVLAMQEEPVSRAGLSEVLKRLDVRAADGRAFTAATLNAILARAEEQGIVALVRGAEAYQTTSFGTHALLMELLRRHSLRPLADKIMGTVPRFGRSMSESGSESRRRRDLVLNLHLRQSSVAADVVDWETRNPSFEHDALVDGLGFEVPHAVLSLLSPDLLDEYVKRSLPISLKKLGHLGPDVHGLLFASKSTDPAFLADRSLYAALRGRFDTAEKLLGSTQHPRLIATRSALSLLSARTDEARTLARRAMTMSLGPEGSETGGVPGIAMPIALLALAVTGSRDDRDLVEVQLQAAARHGIYGHPGAYRALKFALANLNEGARDVLTKLREAVKDDDLGKDWLTTVCWAAVAGWITEERQAVLDSALGQVVDRATQAGFVGLLRELTPLYTRAGGSALLALHEPTPAWEQALGALDLELDRLSAGDTSEEERSQRLVFEITLDEEGLELAARSESGKHRQTLPFRKLLSASLSEGWLDAHDRRVIAELQPDSDDDTVLRLPGKGAVALVGHPRVCWEDEPMRFVAVIAQTPRLVVHGTGNNVSVQIEPRPEPGAQVSLRREGDALVVYALSEAQARIAKTLETQALQLPTHETSRLAPTLERLASVFDVESAVVLPGAEEAPNNKLVVQLWRRTRGLSVRVRVRPFGLVGPSFGPGVGEPMVIATLRGEDGRVRTAKIKRNLAAEQKELETLLLTSPRLAAAPREGEDRRILDPLDCLELLEELSRIGESVRLEWPEGQPLTVAGTLETRHMSIQLQQGAGWLEASGDVTVSPELSLDLRALVKRLSSAPGRFVELDEGRFVALSDDLREKLEQLRDLSDPNGDGLKLHNLSLGALESWVTKLETATLDDATSARLNRVREASALEAPVPEELDATLRHYQEDGFKWLTRLSHWGAGAILADDMGLGKTLQVLALLLKRRELGPALVVAPTSVCPNWIEEAARFAKDLRVTQLGPGNRQKAIEDLTAGDVMICSYGLLQQEGEHLAKMRFASVVLDEAQAIKNAATQRAKVAHSLKGDVRIAMTGTPVENHLGELWSIFSFVNPGLLGTARQFDDRYGKPIQNDKSVSASESLRRIVRPFVLRRTKSEVLSELPEKTTITLHIEQTGEERAFYEALRKEALARSKEPNKPNEERMRLLADLMRLRRAACHPKLVAPEVQLGSAKLSAFLAIVDELREEGHRALVFSQFVDHLAIVRTALEERGISYQYLDGQTPQEHRAKAVRAFQDGAGDLFLISLRAGGFGLNLTAADYVIHLDPWWNPAVEDQATDRAHRIGQTKPITVYRLVARDTVEERILVLHEHKRALFETMLEGTGSGGALDLDELRAILGETHELRG